jgi:hypothetical protein
MSDTERITVESDVSWVTGDEYLELSEGTAE